MERIEKIINKEPKLRLNFTPNRLLFTTEQICHSGSKLELINFKEKKNNTATANIDLFVED